VGERHVRRVMPEQVDMVFLAVELGQGCLTVRAEVRHGLFAWSSISVTGREDVTHHVNAGRATATRPLRLRQPHRTAPTSRYSRWSRRASTCRAASYGWCLLTWACG
jgi:hypothetical protein